jgi:hypothetical protein
MAFKPNYGRDRAERQRAEAESALKQQLIVLQRKVRGRVQFTNNRWCPSVLKAMMIIRPETLVRWHRAGFLRSN